MGLAKFWCFICFKTKRKIKKKKATNTRSKLILLSSFIQYWSKDPSFAERCEWTRATKRLEKRSNKVVKQRVHWRIIIFFYLIFNLSWERWDNESKNLKLRFVFFFFFLSFKLLIKNRDNSQDLSKFPNPTQIFCGLLT